MARPLKDIDPKHVELLAGVGCPNHDIAAALGVSPDTLERRFAGVINTGRASVKNSLRRKQIEMALKGNTRMLIWMGKQMLGQRDKIEQGTPEEYANMSDDQLRAHVLAELTKSPAYQGISLDSVNDAAVTEDETEDALASE